MREKKRCRWLALLLAVVMLLSVLPTAVFAADTDAVSKRILHLDCGRKYFTVDWVKALIKEIAADGYTHLELAFGNDGLRFLLNDMSVTVNDTTYTSDAVKAGIQAGNKAYRDFGTNEWTQSEMDEIIAAAKAANIEIIPLLNTPGHMDAIVTTLSKLGVSNASYNGSTTTIHLENSTAVAFTQALVAKYAAYFKNKGCTIFNMGCDEYANDIYTTGSMGFGNLVSSGKYGEFVTYVNDLAAIVKNAGLTPMAFNDGFYFNGNTSSGTFDTDIMISFWTSGWGGYQSETAAQLEARGHKMINTHGDYYYVLGKDDAFTPGKTTTHDANLYTAAAGWSNKSFPGSTVDSPAGSMFCIWCDYPNAETETQIAANTRLVMRAMAAEMSGGDANAINTTAVVPGGFNADGSLNVLDLTSKISGFQTQMTLNGTQTLNLGESATWTSSNENVITLASTARSVESTSVVATAVGVGSATITAETASAVYAATVHVASDTTDLSDTVVPGSGTAETYVLDTDGLDAGAQYLIVYQGSASATSGKALNTSKGSVEVTISGSNATPAGDASAALWTYKTETGWFSTSYYLLNGNLYLYPSSSGWLRPTYSLNIDTEKTSVSISKQSNGTYSISNSNAYVAYKNNKWTAQSNSQGLYFYKYAPGTQTWTVNPALQQQRIIDLTVSNDGYTDESWNAYQTALTAANEKLSEVQSETYSSQSAAQAGLAELIAAVNALEAAKDALKKARSITVNYQTADGTTVKTETLRVAEDAASVTLQTPFSAGGKTYAVNNPTLALTAATSYTVTVTEVQEDLTGKTLTVEFWITNQQVTADGDTSMVISAATAGVYSENGVMLSELVPSEGTSGGNPMLFWKGTRLDRDHHQTTVGGVDMTKSGNDFTYIRYWNGSWAYSADGKSWADVADGDQIVAYYLQRTDVTDEITTLVVDWGPQKDNWSDLNYLGTKYVLVDYSVKYESGEESPSSFPTEKSLAFHCDVSTQINGYYYRDLGMVRGLETKDYEIYMITLTPTSDDPRNILASTAAGNSSYSYRGTEVVAWAATEADLENSGLGTYTSINGNYTYSIGGEPIVSGLQIYRQHGMKVTFYVRAKVTEDSLSVHYIDQTANQEFYSYNIAVKSGTLFNENIGLADPWDGPLANGSVVNSLGKTQMVSAKLSTMPAIGAQYRYSDYTCVKVVRSEDGKEVSLYYTFTNSHTFVIDFGLPLNITAKDLGISGDWTSAAVTGAQYGTATATVGEGVTYTPARVLTEVETLQLTLTDSTGSVTHQIYIYPASNVLYEDDFLTVATNIGSDYTEWTSVPSASAKGATQSADQTTLYGYDDAYKTSTGNSMGSAWTITGLSSGNGSKYLTTTFTGNGFDLIGTCGPDTGYVYLLLQGTENKLVVIDTSYVGGGTLYQVPLAHEMLTNGTYTAYIRAAYRKGTTTAGSGDAGTQMSRAAAFSMAAAPTALDSVYDMVDALFADGFEIDDVEYVYFDDASALAELENSSRATYAMSYALDSASAAATEEAEVNATGRPAGTTVTIDGFRVYRGTNDAYIVSEQNREYVNVLDKVTDGFAAYVEGNANGTGYEKGTYESQGGPQNEIYLVAGKDAVTFQTKLKAGDTVQVSARAVSGTAYLDGKAIQSQTEMYYTVTVGTGGVITIGNTPPEGTAATGMLAIANLKVPADTTFETPTEQTFVTAFAMMRSYSAAPTEPDPEQPGTEEPAPTPVFTPETFKTRVNSIRTRSKKIVTLTITASTDVDHVVVNGKTYYPMNKLLVKWGLSKTYVFTIMDTAGASETRSFEIVAYNADGLASSTYTDAG